MKDILKSYINLSRTERLGYTTLSALLILLIIVWQTMPLWVKPPATSVKEDALLTAKYRAFRAAQALESRDESGPGITTGSLFTFDPNTLDSAGFLRLGLSPRVVKGLMNWRRHGKHFYKKEDLKPLYNLTPEMYERLAPFISISGAANETGHRFAPYQKATPLPATLDLNTTDSATLVRLNGIGPTLAHKIMERRKALGGFLHHKQLTEVYKFNDTVFAMLQQRLVIRPEAIHKIALNTATAEELQRHPYIGEKMARNILLYRNALHRFDNLAQLRQVPLMNEEIYRKIAPYLIVD